jgi:pimeloyl-ACP methyl ester carboxylesterase
MYTPLIGGGLDDKRLVNLAETFARANFPVAIPLSHTKSDGISADDIDDVVAAAELLLNDTAKVGLFGISYGNGPVFAAAADRRLKDKVVFLVSLNGMYDLQHVTDFIQTGSFAYGPISGSLTPHAFTKEVLDKARRANSIPEGADFVQSEPFQKLRAALSPANHIETVTFPVFLIHATHDIFIPYTESLRLRDALKSRVPTSFILTDVIEHGAYHKLTPTNLVQRYLPAVSGFYRAIHYVLKYAA